MQSYIYIYYMCRYIAWGFIHMFYLRNNKNYYFLQLNCAIWDLYINTFRHSRWLLTNYVPVKYVYVSRYYWIILYRCLHWRQAFYWIIISIPCDHQTKSDLLANISRLNVSILILFIRNRYTILPWGIWLRHCLICLLPQINFEE